MLGEGVVDEQLARHELDGAQDPRVADAAAPELEDEPDLVLRGCHGPNQPLFEAVARVSDDSTAMSASAVFCYGAAIFLRPPI